MQCNSKTNWHENMGINIGKKKKNQSPNQHAQQGFQSCDINNDGFFKKISDARFFKKNLSFDFSISIDYLRFIFFGGGGNA